MITVRVDKELLQAERKRAGLTCSKMAEAIGLNNAQSYSAREVGDTKFSLDEVLMTSDVLSLSLDKISAIFFNGKLPIGEYMAVRRLVPCGRVCPYVNRKDGE